MTNKVRQYFIKKLMELKCCDELKASQLLDEIIQYCIDCIEQVQIETNAMDEEQFKEWLSDQGYLNKRKGL